MRIDSGAAGREGKQLINRQLQVGFDVLATNYCGGVKLGIHFVIRWIYYEFLKAYIFYIVIFKKSSK